MINNILKITAIAAVLFISCKKDSAIQLPAPGPPAQLDYIDLADKEIKQQTPAVFIDLDKDGNNDVGFGTQLTGDPIYKQDKLHFLAISDIYTKFPVNINEEVPVMNKSDVIALNNFNGYRWYEASSITLVQKVTGVNVPVFWTGNWKGAIKKYLPVQVLKNNQRFNGWVELTVDIADQKIILHRAAISKVGEKEIKAG